MRLKKLVLENIGAFVNKNIFDFECDKPIVLIGGMNGRGKTTVLESVLLALYGKRSGNLIGNHQKFEDYLRKISNAMGSKKVCSVELSFYINVDKEEVGYKVKRSWKLGTKSLKMDTKVWKNETEDLALSESWDMFIEEILPHAVAPFFFFDGEKISELASAENEEQISTSIKSLLGVDVIEKLIQDLLVIESRNVKALQESNFASELNEQENRIIENKRQIKLCAENLRKLEQEKESLEIKLDELEEKYVVAGGNFVAYREDIERECKLAKDNLESIEGEMLELAAGDLPFYLVTDLLDDILQKTELEQEQKEMQILLKRIPEFYESYCPKDLDKKNIKSFLDYIASKTNNVPFVYEMDEEARYQLKGIRKSFDLVSEKALKLIEEKRRINARIEELENYLHIKTNDDEIEILYTEIKEKTTEIAIKQVKVKNLQTELEELYTRGENLEKYRIKILEKVVSKLETVDEAKRIIHYILQQINILTKYKLELQSFKTELLSLEMTRCFKRLITKEGLIDKIYIEPKTLEFSYYNNQNQKIDKMILSAGEKQLLVIAMLWALGICANTKFPLIIDTPLARLDSSHRASLINNYFPYASEQVIILSTDQEITAYDYSMLKEYIGKEYTLQYHEETMSSTVEVGYFGRFAG